LARNAAESVAEAIILRGTGKLLLKAYGEGAKEVAGTAATGGAKATGAVVDDTIKALPAPRQIDASWSASTYNNGGLMTGIEHVFYRHDLTQDLLMLVSSRKEHLLKMSLVMLITR
jgi:hypothetical protein